MLALRFYFYFRDIKQVTDILVDCVDLHILNEILKYFIIKFENAHFCRIWLVGWVVVLGLTAL